MKQRPAAPAAERNRDPIMAVLADELTGSEQVLEIGSGTGQHAVHFARNMPGLFWQTSDLLPNHAGIEAWIEYSGCANVAPPIELDVAVPPTIGRTYDAVYAANTAHIMSESEVESMFRVVGCALRAGGCFFLYGPFKVDGRFSTESNERFDRALREQDAAMGIRDLDVLDGLAKSEGLDRIRTYGMPANNLLVVWRKCGDSAAG